MKLGFLENAMRHFLLAPFLAWARRLRHPALFKLVAGLFLLTLFIPDPIPFVDEILLALATMALGSWKRSRPAVSSLRPLKALPARSG